jgi:hypothetical protein
MQMKTFILLVTLLLSNLLPSITVAQEQTVVTDDGTVYQLVNPVQQPTKVAPGQEIRLDETCATATEGFWRQSTTCNWEQTLVASNDGLTIEAGGSTVDSKVRGEMIVILIGIASMLAAMSLIGSRFGSIFFAAPASSLALLATASTGTTFTSAITFVAFLFSCIVVLASKDLSKKLTLAFGAVYCGLMIVALLVW